LTRTAVLCAISFPAAGCSGPLSTLDPAGPVAASVATLWWVMFVGAVVLFAMVAGLLALAFLRPGTGRGLPDSLWLIGGGLVLPAVVLTPLTIYALFGGERLVQARADAALQIDVIARQWEWQFIYPGADGMPRRSVNVLHIPAGKRVRLNVTSTDVIHSFWVPRLAGKIDAVPGHTNVLQLSADAPGRYRGLCAEFCGAAHTEMLMAVEAHDSIEQYNQAVAALPEVEQPIRTGAEARP